MTIPSSTLACSSSHPALRSPRTRPGCPWAWSWPRPLRETSWRAPHPTRTAPARPRLLLLRGLRRDLPLPWPRVAMQVLLLSLLSHSASRWRNSTYPPSLIYTNAGEKKNCACLSLLSPSLDCFPLPPAGTRMMFRKRCYIPVIRYPMVLLCIFI